MAEFKITLHQNETCNFKYNEDRPIVKRIFEESYIVPDSLVVEQAAEFLDVPTKRYKEYQDLPYDLKKVLSEKEVDEFIKRNNKILDFWEKTKPQIEEWLVLFASRSESNFKHFTINLESLSWNNHSLDTPDDVDKSYILISAI